LHQDQRKLPLATVSEEATSPLSLSLYQPEYDPSAQGQYATSLVSNPFPSDAASMSMNNSASSMVYGQYGELTMGLTGLQNVAVEPFPVTVYT